MVEKTNRNQVRDQIAAVGWYIVWGDLVNEWDLVTMAISLGTGTIGALLEEQAVVQLDKFAQSWDDVSEDVKQQAITILDDIRKGKKKGEWDISGLRIKGGIATYKHWWKIGGIGGWNKLLNNH
jgi:hypothetical protein